MKRIIPVIVIVAFLMLTFGCNTIPDEKEAMDFARRQTTQKIDSNGRAVPVDQKEVDAAFTLFYSEKFANAVLRNDVEKAKLYAERVTVYYAVNNNTPQRDRWREVSATLDKGKIEELKPMAQEIEAEFAKAKK